MERATVASNFLSKILEYVASTHVGQFLVQKVDNVLWAIEQPAKFCVYGERSEDKQELPWPVFWIILINLQIIRVIASSISVKLNKDAIEAMDVVKKLRKLRRSLRSIRFRGLKMMRQFERQKSNKIRATSSPLEYSGQYRYSNEELDNNILEEMMSRSFSDNDDLDTTFTVSRFEDVDDDLDSTFTISRATDVSVNVSSNEDSLSEDASDCQSPLKSQKDSHKSIRQPGGQQPSLSLKAKKISFKETVEEMDESPFTINKEGSSSALNEESRKESENIPSKAESDQNIPLQSEGGPSNQPTDKESTSDDVTHVDTVISKLVEMQKEGGANSRINANVQQGTKSTSKNSNDVKLTGVKKRKNFVKYSLECRSRQQPKE